MNTADIYLKLMQHWMNLEDSPKKEKVGDILDRLWRSMSDEEVAGVNKKLRNE